MDGSGANNPKSPFAIDVDIDDVQTPVVIAVGDVARILHHICPPSALQPLPRHLLSVPLFQRHHFLAISPRDPVAYLTWPGDSNPQRVLALLEGIRPEDWPPDGLNVQIRYAADPDAVYAHVRIDSISAFHLDTQSSVQLIFLWDQPSSSWKYHNSAFGDFPKHAHSDLSHTMAFFHFPNDLLPERICSSSVNNLVDDDAYWNAYGTSEQSLQSIPVKPVIGADTEDAYWAQYASIQGQCAPEFPPDPHTNQSYPSGSADSTTPSPRSRDRQLPPAEGDQRIFVPSYELNPDLRQFDLYNSLAPLLPSSLSRRLAPIPTRSDYPPPDENDPSSASASTTSPSPDADLIGAERPLAVLPRHSGNAAVQLIEAISNPADEALKNTIQGLYQLWQTGEKSRQDFLALVEHAIEELSWRLFTNGLLAA